MEIENYSWKRGYELCFMQIRDGTLIDDVREGAAGRAGAGRCATNIVRALERA